MIHQRLRSQEDTPSDRVCYWHNFDGVSDFFAHSEQLATDSKHPHVDIRHNIQYVAGAVRRKFGAHSASAAWGVNQLAKAKKICLTPEVGALKKREEKMLELAGMLTKALKMPAADSIKRKLVRGTFGDELDIHQVNNGALDRAWTKRRKTRIKNVPTYCLMMQTSFPWHFDSRRYGYIGPALAYALMELGRKAGHNVSMVGYSYAGEPFVGSRNDYLWTVPIAVTGKRLLLTNFSRFTLGAFSRYFGCYAMCDIAEPYATGLGLPHVLTDEEPKKFLAQEHVERLYGTICTVNHIKSGYGYPLNHQEVRRRVKRTIEEALESIPADYQKHLVKVVDDEKLDKIARFVVDNG